MTTTYNVKVGYDGNIENYEYTLNFSKSTIDMIKSMSAIGNKSYEFDLKNFSNEIYSNLSQKYPNAEIKINSYMITAEMQLYILNQMELLLVKTRL